MAKKNFICLLLCSAVLCRTIIKSDLEGEYLRDGDPVTKSAYPYSTSFPTVGAFWIWGPNWNSVPDGEVREFTQTFYLQNWNPITLYATADNQFEAYINGRLVLSGKNWKQVYSAKVTCNLDLQRPNQLKIVAKNWENDNPAGLIYSIIQNNLHLQANN